MKVTILLLSIFIFLIALACHEDCSRGEYPRAPYGPADSWDEYYGHGDYRSVTYTYYCYQGEYHSISYVSEDSCDEWHEGYHYRGECIR